MPTRTCSVVTASKECGRAMRQTPILPTDGGPQYVIYTCDNCDRRACNQCRVPILDGSASECPAGHRV